MRPNIRHLTNNPYPMALSPAASITVEAPAQPQPYRWVMLAGVDLHVVHAFVGDPGDIDVPVAADRYRIARATMFA